MEFVYVLKRYDLFDRAFPHGFVAERESPEVATYFERIRERGFFVERRFAEEDSSLKQIIPYCVVTFGEETLLFQRFAKGEESRLFDKLSIGVGGHLNPVDAAGGDLLRAGLKRELHEELDLDTAWTAEPIGIINDESNDVGSVHFGVVCRVRLEEKRARVREKDKMGGEFLGRPALLETWRARRDRFETWSDLILENQGQVFE